jgi:hypothetical protein
MTPDQAAALQTLQMHAIQPVLPTPEKRWYDRVVDSILGEDPGKLARRPRAGKRLRLIGIRSARLSKQVCAGLRGVLPTQWSRGDEVRMGEDA